MGLCASSDSRTNSDNDIAAYTEINITIGSYTKGLKTKIREVMAQSGIVGSIKKTVYEDSDDIHDTPIHTEVIAGGSEDQLAEFSELIREVVEPTIDFEITPSQESVFFQSEKRYPIIEKTDKNIASRKGSDVGDDNESDEGIYSTAVKVTGRMKNKAKKVLSIVSEIPVISEYTTHLRANWSLLIREQPKNLISAKSLFHPYSVYSFSLYQDDTPSVLKACLKWKLRIPEDSIELFTMSGVPLIDSYTLVKEKQCIYVDKRVTDKFFEHEEELKANRMKITQEPYVYHRMALNGLNLGYMKKMYKNMDKKLAQEILKGDLMISGTVAMKILEVIDSNN